LLLQVKKVFFPILSMLYLFSVTGATLHTHFCMGRFAGWAFSEPAEQTCGKCGMDKQFGESSGCCKDKQELVKIDSDHQGVAYDNLKDRIFTIFEAPVPIGQIPEPLVQSFDHAHPMCHAPPRRCSAPLFIFHQSFLI
jgi:hypothetical protein